VTHPSIPVEEILAQPFGTIPELVRLHAARHPRRAALLQDDRTLAYAGLDALMDRVAASLQRDGLGPGAVIAVCAANSIEYAAVFLGALRAGVAVALLAPTMTAKSLASMVADSGATHLFLDAGAARTIEPARDSIGTACIALDGSTAGQSLESWLAASAVPTPVAIQPEWPFNIIYSSGTTGVPKGIVQPHAMRWAHVQRGPVYGYGPSAVTLLSTPLYSNTTLVAFFPTLAMGAGTLLMAKFDAATYLALAERHKATHTMLVPVQYQRIMALPDFHRYDLSSYRMKLSTSAPFAAELKADIVHRWPGALVEFYGMTEGGGTCVLIAHEHPDKLHTVGCPAPGHDIRLIDEHGCEVPRGEVGEVVGHSAGMMTGYHRQPEATAKAEWFDATGKRFIRTGDVGRFDTDGFLILLDRKKDLIISGGFNVYPSDLEAVLCEHADVADAAVVGVPSTQWGETPVAFVVTKNGTGLKPRDLLAWANARVGKLQRLAAVEFVESLPRSAIGKVLKRELRAAYIREAQRSP
jgi:acyl-CoA synthetase (AMP-forming)/AMP-acid ligase II